jgi:hypothetical protein
MYNLTAVLSLKDDYSSRMKRIIAQTQVMKRATATTSLAVTGLGSVMTATSAVGVAAVGALGASFASAGIGALAYGAVATSALTKVFDASEELGKIQEKIDQAGSVKERVAAQKELAALYKDMSTEQKGALTNLQEFRGFWSGFVKDFEKPIFKAFAEGLTAAQTVLTKLKPTISSVADTVVRLMQGFNSALGSSGAAQFFEWLETNASRSLTNFMQVATNTFAGVGSLLQAFTPLGIGMENSLVRLTQRFREWAASLSGTQGFKDFVAYVQTNGPTLMTTLGNVAGIIKDVVEAFAPLGTKILDALKAFTSFIDKSNLAGEAMVGFAAAIVSYRIAVTGAMIVATLTGLIKAYKAAATTATFAQWALNAAMAANPIGLVAIAIAGAVTAAVLLYRNWDKVKAKTQELWNKFSVLRGILLNLPGPFGQIVSAGIRIISNWSAIKSKASSVFGAVKGWINGVISKWNSFKSAVTSFKMPSIKLPSIGSIKAGLGGGKKDGSHYHGLGRVPSNGYRAVLHKDEAVLDRKQAKAWRSGQSGGRGGNVIIQGNTFTIREEADINKIASALARQIYLAGEAGA